MSNRRLRSKREKLLAFEPLEPRLTLAAAGLIPVGTQPAGGLSDKIVYLHGGHGWISGSGFQRPELFEMIEDLGNQDQMTFLADYLFRAGATVVPLRPIGHQTNEVVLDNDDPGVTFVTLSGPDAWSNSSSTVFYGSAGDVPYRFATSSLTETAYARYRPNISEAGFYPVYTWVTPSGNRAPDQLYRINHSGGITEVKINHRRVGNGLVYLGTYHFDAGTNGYVDISNRSASAGNAVIADMIRFGNGIGSSGLAREDETGLDWIKRHADPPYAQGISSSTHGTSTVSAPPLYAAFMNREADGALKDRLFFSFHSNSANTTSRGTLGLYNGNNDPATATPNQFLLANTLGLEVNNDMVAQNGQFEYTWFDRGSNVTLDRSDIEFGEINNLSINSEFDATIVEVAFHDNQLDAELMRDPKVRDAAARAAYQGMIKYFRAVDNNTTPATELPPPVTGVHAESNASGSVTISWVPPTSNSYAGGAPTGYRIYASVDGYGFDGGTVVAGGATNTVTLTGYDPNTMYYFKVAATNVGGESAGSDVMAVLPSGGAKRVLIVNGFDRLNRSLDPRQTPVAGTTVDRVRPRESNSRDYAIQVATAIQSARPGFPVNSTSNEAVISGAVNLANYQVVVWILGEESTTDDTFNATEQSLVTSFLTGGGKLFVSGAEIGYELEAQGGGASFYNNTLKTDYVADAGGSYTASGTSGSIFQGISLTFDDGTLFYDVDFPDRIAAIGGSAVAMNYTAPGSGGAAIQYVHPSNGSRVVNFGFPFETITTAANRTAVMDRVLDFFYPSGDFNNSGVVNAADYVMWRKWNGASVTPFTQGDASGDGQVNQNDYVIWREQFGATIATAAPLSDEAPLLPAATLSTESKAVSELDPVSNPVGIATAVLSPPVVETQSARRSVTFDEPANADEFDAALALLNLSSQSETAHESSDDSATANSNSLDAPSDECATIDEAVLSVFGQVNISII
jgi:hypothetical protein